VTAIRRVGVVGAGTMGHGIAYVALAAGYEVALADADPAALDLAVTRIRTAFGKAIERGKSTAEQRDDALRRLECVPTPPEAATDADVVVEAVPEHLELKQRVLAELEGAAPPDALLASNTSSLPISELASGCSGCTSSTPCRRCASWRWSAAPRPLTPRSSGRGRSRRRSARRRSW
jgi:3-hydroxybutyryl-CoA dehydrogenase